ncbi:LOW QUALITY PROTEIN: ubiquitin-like modifier-activating enzyme ATG7 [Stylophora pistillata]|uniref:LOW QUALITY PROTEIN: ubiquitin-like modifier-activating enzyme ATG7 n=1 Tax=Stylophora pistillata TaxID=50429 RepID=UPI000C039DD1|nr:LOW QUALITY PROTEIN: ubiquitin-like modifier-activating enzyme ATG7 [Stylophora pistillata]
MAFVGNESGVQFAPYSSAVDAAFWHRLTQNKLEIYQLDDKPQPLQGYYVNSDPSGLVCRFNLDYNAFSIEKPVPQRTYPMQGTLINTNTIEAFRTYNKMELIQSFGQKIWDTVKSGKALEDPSVLCQFVLMTFADLKKYKFYYWFAFPALCPETSATHVAPPVHLGDYFTPSQIASLQASYDSLSVDGLGPGFFLVKVTESEVTVGNIQEWETFFNIDDSKASIIISDLNLKLMRWRLLPSLDLDKIARTKCLLLGAGTLGCNVARCLLGWGVRTITFVDYGTISFSNPVRQTLFEFADCQDGGKPKAETAASALKRIFPGVNASAVQLSIPMPGHSVGQSPEEMEKVQEDVKKLEELIESHDAVFLLMDTRESRWLPTVIGAIKGKFVITAALGFDTFLVMRHGPRRKAHVICEGASKLESIPGAFLGCYFCNDVVAPGDSTRDRTLDQQCTVSRPGMSYIASALAVELLVSLTQHPLGNEAAADTSAKDAHLSADLECKLGLVPHQIRGFLSRYHLVLPASLGFDKCIACSSKVLSSYEEEKFSFLMKVFNVPSYLEDLTGLTQLLQDTRVSEVWEMSDDEMVE